MTGVVRAARRFDVAIVDRINDLQGEKQRINDQLADLQNKAQPLQARKQEINAELDDLKAIVAHRASFDAWKAANP